jgi:hypothetical protein
METTIIKTVKGATMEQLFNDDANCNIRYYKALNLKNEKDYNPEEKYRFEILIRHTEETEAEKLFQNAIIKI